MERGNEGVGVLVDPSRRDDSGVLSSEACRPPTLSVVIPVYNAGAFLDEAVASALQSPVTEVVLIDDGSRDDSLERCRRWAADPRVRLVRHPDHGNHGAGATRNRGIRCARGALVCMLDADDRFLPGRFLDAVRILCADPACDGVYEPARVVAANADHLAAWRVANPFARPQWRGVRYRGPPEGLMRAYFRAPVGYFCTGSTVLRRRVFRRIGLYDPDLRLAQDAAFHHRLVAACRLRPGSRRPVLEVRRHAGNRSVVAHPDYPDAPWRVRRSVWLWARYRGDISLAGKGLLRGEAIAYLWYRQGDGAPWRSGLRVRAERLWDCLQRTPELILSLPFVLSLPVRVARRLGGGGACPSRQGQQVGRSPPRVQKSALRRGAGGALAPLGREPPHEFPATGATARSSRGFLRPPTADCPQPVSVVIPVYRAAGMLERSVRSALQQPEVGEVVLVEDHSPDDSLAVCERMRRTDARVRVLRTPGGRNRGASVARNVGLAATRLPLLTFLDADDRMLPRRLERAVAILAADPDCDAVFEPVRIAFPDAAQRRSWYRYHPDGHAACHGLVPEPSPRRLCRGFFTRRVGEPHVSGVVLRRRVLDRIGGFDPALRLAQDSAWMWRLVAACRLRPGARRPVAVVHRHADNRSVVAHPHYADGPWRVALSTWSWARRRDLGSMRRRYLRAAVAGHFWICRSGTGVRSIGRRRFRERGAMVIARAPELLVDFRFLGYPVLRWIRAWRVSR